MRAPRRRGWLCAARAALVITVLSLVAAAGGPPVLAEEGVIPVKGTDLRNDGTSVTPAGVYAGETAHFQAAVSNDGDTAFDAFTVQFVVDDQVIGEAPGKDLAPKTTVIVESPPWTARAGQVDVITFVNPAGLVGDTNSDNNSSFATIDVLEKPPPGSVDLVAKDVVPVDPGVGDGAATQFRVRVANLGTNATPPTTVRVSVDGSRGLPDAPVPEIAPGSDVVVLTEPWKASLGAHKLAAVVDPDGLVKETSEANNSAAQPFTVYPGGVEVRGLPDLAVTPPVASDPRPAAGAMMTLLTVVRNVGPVDSGAFGVRFFDGTTQIGTVSVPGIAAGRSLEVASPAFAAAGGDRVLRAAIVGDVAQSATDNDSRSSKISVAAALAGKPDLTVGGVSVTPSGADAGTPLQIVATVRNVGTNTSAPATVRFTMDGRTIGEATSPSLAPSGASAVASGPISASAGQRVFGAEIIRLAEEASYENNALAVSRSISSRVETFTSPNLVAANLWVIPGRPVARDPSVFMAAVRNEGVTASPGFFVRFVLDGAVLNEGYVARLSPGEEASVMSATWTAVAGSHQIQVRVDPTSVVRETNESDNERSLGVAVPAQSPGDVALRVPAVGPVPTTVPFPRMAALAPAAEMGADGAHTPTSATTGAPSTPLAEGAPHLVPACVPYVTCPSPTPSPTNTPRASVTPPPSLSPSPPVTPSPRPGLLPSPIASALPAPVASALPPVASALPSTPPLPSASVPPPPTCVPREPTRCPGEIVGGVPSDGNLLVETRFNATTKWFLAQLSPPEPAIPLTTFIDVDGASGTSPVLVPGVSDLAVRVVPVLGGPTSARISFEAVNPAQPLRGIRVAAHLAENGSVTAVDTRNPRRFSYLGFAAPSGSDSGAAPTSLTLHVTLPDAATVDLRASAAGMSSGTAILAGTYEGDASVDPAIVGVGGMPIPAAQRVRSARKRDDASAALRSPTAVINVVGLNVRKVQPDEDHVTIDWRAPSGPSDLSVDVALHSEEPASGSRSARASDTTASVQPMPASLHLVMNKTGPDSQQVQYRASSSTTADVPVRVAHIEARSVVTLPEASATHVSLDDIPATVNVNTRGDESTVFDTGPTPDPAGVGRVFFHSIKGTTVLPDRPGLGLFSTDDASKEIQVDVPRLRAATVTKGPLEGFTNPAMHADVLTAAPWTLSFETVKGGKRSTGRAVDLPRRLVLNADFVDRYVYRGDGVITALDVTTSEGANRSTLHAERIPPAVDLTFAHPAPDVERISYTAGTNGVAGASPRLGALTATSTTRTPVVRHTFLDVRDLPPTVNVSTRGDAQTRVDTGSPPDRIGSIVYHKIDAPAFPADRSATNLFVDRRSGELRVAIPGLVSANYSFGPRPGTSGPQHRIELVTTDPWPLTFEYLAPGITVRGDVRNVPGSLTLESDFDTRLEYTGSAPIGSVTLHADQERYMPRFCYRDSCFPGAFIGYSDTHVEARDVPTALRCGFSVASTRLDCTNSGPMTALHMWGSRGSERRANPDNFDARVAAIPFEISVAYDARATALAYNASARTGRAEATVNFSTPIGDTAYTRMSGAASFIPARLDARFDESTQTMTVGAMTGVGSQRVIGGIPAPYPQVDVRLSDGERPLGTAPPFDNYVVKRDVGEHSLTAHVRGLRYLMLSTLQPAPGHTELHGTIWSDGGSANVQIDEDNQAEIQTSLPSELRLGLEFSPGRQLYELEPRNGRLTSPHIWACVRQQGMRTGARRCTSGVAYDVSSGDVTDPLTVEMTPSRIVAGNGRNGARDVVVLVRNNTNAPFDEEVTGGQRRIDIRLERAPERVDVGWPQHRLWADTRYAGRSVPISGSVLLARDDAAAGLLNGRYVTRTQGWPWQWYGWGSCDSAGCQELDRSRYENVANILLQEREPNVRGTESQLNGAYVKVRGVEHFEMCMELACAPWSDGFRASIPGVSSDRSQINLDALIDRWDARHREYRPLMEAYVERDLPRDVAIQLDLKERAPDGSVRPRPDNGFKHVAYVASTGIAVASRPADPVPPTDRGIGGFMLEMPQFTPSGSWRGNGVFKFTAQALPQSLDLSWLTLADLPRRVNFPTDGFAGGHRDRWCPERHTMSVVVASVVGTLDLSDLRLTTYDRDQDGRVLFGDLWGRRLIVLPGWGGPLTSATVTMCGDPPGTGGGALINVGTGPLAERGTVRARLYRGRNSDVRLSPTDWYEWRSHGPGVDTRIQLCPGRGSPGFAGALYVFAPFDAFSDPDPLRGFWVLTNGAGMGHSNNGGWILGRPDCDSIA